jgi:hypothetical protein
MYKVDITSIKKHAVILGILLLCLSVSLSGCDQISNLFLSDEGRIVGTWNSDWDEIPTEFVFTSNGTVTASIDFGEFHYSSEGTWEISNGKLSLEIGDFMPFTQFTYQFADDAKTLMLTTINGNTTHTLTKQA